MCRVSTGLMLFPGPCFFYKLSMAHGKHSLKQFGIRKFSEAADAVAVGTQQPSGEEAGEKR